MGRAPRGTRLSRPCPRLQPSRGAGGAGGPARPARAGLPVRVAAARRHGPPAPDERRPRPGLAAGAVARRHDRLRVRPGGLPGRLAVLVPRPRINLLLYDGVLGARAGRRAEVVSGQGARTPSGPRDGQGGSSNAETWTESAGCARGRQWANLMQRTFGFDVLACPRCGGRLRLLALIEQAVRHPPHPGPSRPAGGYPAGASGTCAAGARPARDGRRPRRPRHFLMCVSARVRWRWRCAHAPIPLRSNDSDAAPTELPVVGGGSCSCPGRDLICAVSGRGRREGR